MNMNNETHNSGRNLPFDTTSGTSAVRPLSSTAAPTSAVGMLPTPLTLTVGMMSDDGSSHLDNTSASKLSFDESQSG
jgi:hypothetical protein